MKSMAVRAALLCLFVGASGVAAYVLWTGESLARRDEDSASRFANAALAVEHNVMELRAAQQAYVAAGQGEYWIGKAAETSNQVRAGIDSLRSQAASSEAQSSIDNAASALTDFERMDRRARDYTRNGHRLLASDLIFADGLESTGAMVASLNRARTAEIQARNAAVRATRRTEAMALAMAGLVGFAVVLLLARRPKAAGTSTEPVDTADRSPLATFDLRPRFDATPLKAEEAPPSPAVKPALDFDAIASLCTDLARVAETRALPTILGRAATGTGCARHRALDRRSGRARTEPDRYARLLSENGHSPRYDPERRRKCDRIGLPHLAHADGRCGCGVERGDRRPARHAGRVRRGHGG